jgi:hypothetical protein
MQDPASTSPLAATADTPAPGPVPVGGIRPYDGDITGGTGDYSAMASYAYDRTGAR